MQARTSHIARMNTTKQTEVTVADLKDQIGSPYPRSLLLCEVCGNEYSANAGDYWNLPKTHVFECCGIPMTQVIKRTVFEVV